MNTHIIAQKPLEINTSDITLGEAFEAIGKLFNANINALSKLLNPDYQKDLLRILRKNRTRRSKKREDLVSTIKAVNYFGMEFANTDLAFIVGCSREYVSRNLTNITKIAEKEKKCDIRELERFKAKSLELMLTKAKTHKEIIGAYFAHSVRFETDILDRIEDSGDLVKIGTSLVEISRRILERKPEEGEDHSAKVYSQSWAVKHLQIQKIDLIDKFFRRDTPGRIWDKVKKEYKQPPYTWFMLFTTKERLEKVVKQAVKFIFKSKKNTILYTNSYLNVTLKLLPVHRESFKCDFKKLTFTTVSPTIFVVSPEIFAQYSFRSQLLLLDKYLGYRNGKLIFDANHSSGTNQNFGRSHNVVSRIKSEERQMAGYTSYDISAALQVIALNFVDNPKKNYPMLSHYSKVKSYKSFVRSKIAEETGWSISKVKQALTAYSNGGSCRVDNELLQAFAKESDRLRREFMRSVWISHPEVVERAIRQSKRKIDTNVDWIDVSLDDSREISQNKSSIFFFTWSWFERKIRVAMLDLIPDGIEVHDAVYSLDGKISLTKLRKHIKAVTGLNSIMLTKE